MEGTLNLVGYGLSAIGPAIATGMILHQRCSTPTRGTFCFATDRISRLRIS
jgi:hypothetical protein